MLRFLAGILLIQLATLALFWVNLDAPVQDLLIRAGLPALLLALVTALWFANVNRIHAERASADLRIQHAAEREKLSIEAERSRAEVMEQAGSERARLLERAGSERAELLKEAHQELLKNERRVSRSANLKVGLAFAGVTAAGVLLLLTQLLTLGLITITTASGALGGYLFRWRQTRRLSSTLATQSLPRSPDDGDAIEGKLMIEQLPGEDTRSKG